MEMTYNDALATVIKHTEIGYTLASQDRLWIVFIYDLWSDGDSASFRYNRLYPIRHDGEHPRWAYDLTIEGVLVWTTRAEAEAYADGLRAEIDEAENHETFTEHEKPEVYVMNLGDDARYKARWIRRYGTPCRDNPKFKGSQRAWLAQIEMEQRW